MNIQSWQVRLRNILPIIFASVLLVACGGGGSDGGASTASGGGTADQLVNISGSVGDGPVVGADIEAYTSDGQLIGTFVSDSSASFRSQLKVKGKDFPVLLKATGGFDLVTGREPDFELLSVIESPADKYMNITPITSLIVRTAMAMRGGLTDSNINAAKNAILEKFGFGLDLNLIEDPLTTEITDLNVANMVMANEAMGEMIRRTRDQLLATGSMATGDSVMKALAADFRDGVLDGNGAADTESKISSLAHVISAAVLVELMSNNLKVGDIVATNIIDQAIKTTHPNVTSAHLTDSVPVTGQELHQARLSLTAVQVLDSSDAVKAIADTVATIAPGTLPTQIEKQLPADTSDTLDNAITMSLSADETQIASINLAGSTGDIQTVDGGQTGTSGSTSGGDSTTTVTTNTAPVISGTPATSVTANDRYAFRPTASDADGDTLSFTVSNIPGWASFDSSNGSLTGTPDNNDAGIYGNIVISVSDGEAQASLPPFDLQVYEDVVPTTGAAITIGWSAPTVRADGSPLAMSDINGYHIYLGEKSGSYPSIIDVADGSATSTTITDMSSGTYYLVMTAYDRDGYESRYSAESVINIQ